MEEKIVEILKPLNIDIDFLEYRGKSDKYIVFNIYDQGDAEFFDDKNDSEINYITLNYWYKSIKDKGLYKQIKKIMKKNGFKFDGLKEMKEGNLYGINMDFIYEEFITEED